MGHPIFVAGTGHQRRLADKDAIRVNFAGEARRAPTP
jgi:hypothetical protein